ncbi:Highly reducing polyketide synthase ACRTS2 [Colletotrichum siamense]|nr:Highly reducing polyketide synthase ACRTS2 [Colletotrichum siamense]
MTRNRPPTQNTEDDRPQAGQDEGNIHPPLAIVGYAYRAPLVGRSGLWDLLAEARCASSPVPPSRFNQDAYHCPIYEKPGYIHSKGGHFMPQDIHAFDAAFFNIRRDEAKAMDPQQRITIECAFEAFENAGWTLRDIAGRNVAVFAAHQGSTYAGHAAEDLLTTSAYSASGTAGCMLANRISYLFDLRGPSAAVDTACASSSYAFHLACQSVRLGECEAALVSAANLLNGPELWSMLDTVGVLSPEGKCFSYDHRASGFGRGEGSACLVVKPLAAALADGNTVRAIIRNTAASHSGRVPGGITVPSQEAQEGLARRVHMEVGLDPRDTGFVEGHGTGTAVGDPIDAAAISSVYASQRSPTSAPVFLGSVKSNIGHLEGASGLLSLIKSTMMLERRVMLPNANFEKFNPAILNASGAERLRVLKETMPWPTSSSPRRVCVTNYGLGGANSAILLEEAPDIHVTNGDNKLDETPWVFVVSAGSNSSLGAYVASLAEYLASHEAQSATSLLRNISFTLGQRRTHFTQSRRAVVAQSLSELREQMLEISGVSPRPTGLNSKASGIPIPGFVFTGQGAQHAGMVTGLRRYPPFAAALKRASRCLENLGASWSIEEELERSAEAGSRINDAEISQPACTIVQLALVQLLRAWRVEPAAVAGHSSGEIAAAFAAGLISFETAVAVAYLRGQAALQVTRDSKLKGAMVAVGVGKDEAEKLVAEALGDEDRSKVTIAAVNSPASVTISGDQEAIETVQDLAEKRGLNPRRLKVSVAYHSHHMQTVAESYKALLEPHLLSNHGEDNYGCKAVFVSSVTGQVESALDASYWVRNLVQPVLFSDALKLLLSLQKGDDHEKPINVIIEIGPHSALRGPIRQILESLRSSNSHQTQVAYLPSLQRGTYPITSVLNFAGRLFEAGADLDFEQVNQTSRYNARLATDLPAYAWNHETSYIHRPRVAEQKLFGGSPYNALLGGRTAHCEGDEHSFRNVFTLDDMPWLRDHVVGGDILFPFTGFLALAFEAVKTVTALLPKGGGIAPESMMIKDLTVRRSLKVVEDQRVDVTTKLKPLSGGTQETSTRSSSPHSWMFEILSWSEENGWNSHCRGCIAAAEPLSPTSFVVSEAQQVVNRMVQNTSGLEPRRIDPAKEYRTAANSGTAYGPSFTAMTELWVSPNHDATTHVTVLRPEALSPPSAFLPLSPVTVDPPTLDSFFHGIHILHERADGVRGVYVPTNVSRLRVSNRIQAEAGQSFTIVSRVLEHSRQNGRMDFSIVVFAGALADPGPRIPILEIDRATVKRVRQPSTESIIAGLPASYAERLLPHIDFVDGRDLAAMLEDPSLEHDQLDKRRLGNQVACGYMALALPQAANDDLTNLPHHLLKLRSAVHKFASSWPGPRLPEESSSTLSLASLRPLADAIGPAGTLLRIIGEKLVPIMRNEVQSLELMMQDGLLWQHYQDEAAFRRGNQAMARYARTLAATKSNLRILEVGGGTAGTTKPVLEALSSPEVFPFAEYVFTDISSGFFEKGREKLARWSDRMTFERLDISKDPVRQSTVFAKGSFDLVVASLVMHATPDLAVSLAHVRSLLKPGGRLLMLESMHMAPLDLAYLGLPGWWLAEDAYRASGEPLVGQDVWDRALKDSGFTGVDGAVEDYPGHPERNVTAIWSMAAAEPDATEPVQTSDLHSWGRDPTPEVIVCGFWKGDDGLQTLNFAQQVALQLESQLNLGSPVVLHELSEYLPIPTAYCIFVDGLHRSVFDSLTASCFEKIKSLIIENTGILWISPGHVPPEGGLAKGLLRSLRHENPEKLMILLEGATLDTEGQQSAKAVARIAKFVAAGTNMDLARLRRDQDLVLKDGQIHINRLIEKKLAREAFAGELGVVVAKDEQPIPQDEAVELTISSTGDLDAIYFQRTPILDTSPGDDEIIVNVQAASLNFRDVLILLGSIPWQAPGREGAGEVVRVGRNVMNFKPGDRVFYYTTDKASSLANFVSIPCDHATPVPTSLSVEEAASLPTAYYTAIASLETLANLQPGETLLIHSAAGAVGQVCIQLAQHLGARIFATAGTPERREFLQQEYSLAGVFNSRTTSFRDDILRATNGKGVDVIVNSLSGDLLQATWDLIANGGRFVEIGRVDFLAGSSLAMRPFDRNASFIGLDISRRPMTERRTAMSRIVELLDQGVLRPLRPLTLVPISELQKGLRKLQQGQIIGKAIVTVSPSDKVVIETRTPLATAGRAQGSWLSSAATYLITGGTGGIGRSLAAWMIGNGAGHVVLLGRSGASHPKVARMLGAYTGRLHSVKCDVGQRSDLVRALAEIKDEGLPPVRGVIHGALFLRDALFTNTTFEDWQNITAPKVAAAWSLHELVPDLDFFVSLSSMTGVFGTLGQPAYCAASAFLNSFARYRLSRGLPASSICLPLVEDIGYVAESLGNEDEWRRSLGLTLKEEHIHALVKSAIVAPSSLYDAGVGLSLCFTAHDLTQDWQFPWMNQNYSMAICNGIAGKANLAKPAQRTSGKARRGTEAQDVMGSVAQKIADITMMDLEELDPSARLEDLGLDSLVAVELRNFIRREWAVELSLNQIVGGGSLQSLVEAIQTSQAEFSR